VDLAFAIERKRRAVMTMYGSVRNLRNWEAVWRVYLTGPGTPVPPLVFRRGFTLNHGTLDPAVGLFREVFAERLYSRWIEPDASGVVIDIGANIGAVTLDLLTRCPKVEVHAYEPNPDTCRTLEHNIATNGFEKRVHIYPEAVARTYGLFDLWVGMISAGCTGYSAAAPAPGARLTTVRSVDLNTVVERAAGREIALLKIDAEGAEADILEGAGKGCFDSIRRMVVEYHGCYVANAESRCREVILRNGFDCYAVPIIARKEVGMLYAWRREQEGSVSKASFFRGTRAMPGAA
jgi:FkbM family methyltransferase